MVGYKHGPVSDPPVYNAAVRVQSSLIDSLVYFVLGLSPVGPDLARYRHANNITTSIARSSTRV